MAYRSWLKDVRRVDDLAKYLHFFPNNHREWDREWELEKRQIVQHEKSVVPVKAGMERYFKGSLHDGFILGVEQTPNRIELSISNMELEEFAYQFYTETSQARDFGKSPVRLVFEGVSYANAVRPDLEGWLKWDDWKHWKVNQDSFLRCWFHQEGGKLQWVGQFFTFRSGKEKSSTDLYILIDCERVSAYPESERALRKRMGDDCYDAMLYIDNLPEAELWLASGHLRRYLDEKGIARRIIPDQSERD